MDTNLPSLATWSQKRLLRALHQTNELVTAAGDHLSVNDWRIIHRDEILLALQARRGRRAA